MERMARISVGLLLVAGLCGESRQLPGLIGVARADDSPAKTGLALPKLDARRGRELYIAKGCIGCHAINGVGGAHAAPLDAATMDPAMNPFEFFARMWIGMAPMIAMQEDKMGQQVDLTAQDLGDIVAFIHDAELQKTIKASEIPDAIEDIMED